MCLTFFSSRCFTFRGKMWSGGGWEFLPTGFTPGIPDFQICWRSVYKGDFTLDGNWRGMSRWHRFFCSCACVKVLFTNTFLKCRFLKCRFRWKVEIISTFPLRTNVAFFLNQSFLSIHVNIVSHYNIAHSQSTI